MSCQCRGIEDEFNKRVARLELRQYRRRGPRRTTRLLIDAVSKSNEPVESLLDIGGGIGAIQHEYGKSGVRKIVSVDASTSYIEAAKTESARLELGDRVSYKFGDFVELENEVQSADLVTLDRVLCCYDDVDKLIQTSAAKANKLYAVVYPRKDWWTRAGFRAVNAIMKVRRRFFRTFLHDPAMVEGLVTQAGFTRISHSQGLIWQIVLFQRTAHS